MLDGVTSPRKRVETRDTVVIRFAGGWGDGMQVTGMQFTTESALAGNDLATLPDFPAEIRAPAGTLAGVSAFQLSFSSNEVFTPGDDLDVLVAMNPAALKMNVGDLNPGGILIVDREGFNQQNLQKAEYASNPLEDGSLARYQLFQAEVSKLTTATSPATPSRTSTAARRGRGRAGPSAAAPTRARQRETCCTRPRAESSTAYTPSRPTTETQAAAQRSPRPSPARSPSQPPAARA